MSGELLALLYDAIARETQVSMQHMMQHSLYSGGGSAIEGELLNSRVGKFVASHSPVYFPGKTLKKIAIAEMRHAEAIAERVSCLGGEPTTQPAPFRIGKMLKEILKIDKSEEEGAIKLYNQIIKMATDEGDKTTENLFRRRKTSPHIYRSVGNKVNNLSFPAPLHGLIESSIGGLGPL